MRVDLSPEYSPVNRGIIKRIKTTSTTPLDEKMFVLPTTSVESFEKTTNFIRTKFRSLFAKISELFNGFKGSSKNKPDAQEKTPEPIKEEASRMLAERKAIYSACGGRGKLNNEIKELINARPKLSDAEQKNTDIQKLLKERERHVKDYEITYYADIRLNKDLYQRQLEYLGLEVTEIPKEIQLNYDLAYWKDRFEKTSRDTARTMILKIEEDMSKLGIMERELSEVETLKAKYLDELKIYNCCEQRIARIKEIDAEILQIQNSFKNKT